MEAIAPHALGVEMPGNGIVVSQSVMTAMKGCVEAGDLRHVWGPLQERADRCEIVGLMQGRQRDKALEIGQHLAIDTNGCAIVGAAVDDAVAEGNWTGVVVLPQPCSSGL